MRVLSRLAVPGEAVVGCKLRVKLYHGAVSA